MAGKRTRRRKELAIQNIEARVATRSEDIELVMVTVFNDRNGSPCEFATIGQDIGRRDFWITAGLAADAQAPFDKKSPDSSSK